MGDTRSMPASSIEMANALDRMQRERDAALRVQNELHAKLVKERARFEWAHDRLLSCWRCMPDKIKARMALGPGKGTG